MTSRPLLIFIALMILGVSVSGQETSKLKWKSPNGLTPGATLKLADRYYAESIFYSAAENYELYVHYKPEDRYANYWWAMALYQARDYGNAEDVFRTYFAIKPGKHSSPEKMKKQAREYFKLGRLYYGMALHRNGKYDSAEVQLMKFKQEYYSENPDEQAAVLKLANLELRGCDSAKVMGHQKIKVKILPADGINTPYSQAAPFLYDSVTLYYTSMDANKLIKYTEPKNKHYTYIYKSTKEGKIWGKGVKLPVTINEPGYFTGNGTFNTDRTRFYFTKCLERDDDRALCNIFVADVHDGKISADVKRLPEGINFADKYTTTHPAVRQISSKKEILYFSTDREGGKGGMDIWYTERTPAGEYLAPKPFTRVNTAGDEVTPWYDDSTHTLFFSSDGLPGMGGFDVFATVKDTDGNSWSDPYNIGKPVNSGADELYYSIAPNHTNGFVVSNRNGSIPLAGISTASDDIFIWEELHFAVEGEIVKRGGKSVSINNSYGSNQFRNGTNISSGNGNGAIANGGNGADNGNGTGNGSNANGGNNGGNPANGMNGGNPANGGNSNNGGTNANGAQNNPMAGARFNLYRPLPDGGRELIAVDSSSTNGKYFFDLRPDNDYIVEAVKDGFLPQADTITTKGLDNEDTLKASMKVSKDGFIVYGRIIKDDSFYYPSVPGATVIVSQLEGSNEKVYREVTGNDSGFYYTFIPTEKDYKILARKEGYFANNVHTTTKNLPQNLDSLRVDIKIKKVVINKEYKLSNILYEFGKATLTAGSKLVLDTLYDLLKENPSFNIELSSHTDGKGAAELNMKLSQARAQSCVDYLIKKGISKKRMVPVGYGMNKPIAPNTKPDGTDDPDGRALNRRTEFKITKI